MSLDKLPLLVICTAAIVCCLSVTPAAAKSKWYDGDNVPYEFGFELKDNQHRRESKDSQGRIMGEFGFITADGKYHVTIYSTDEEGNYKVHSRKTLQRMETAIVKMLTSPKIKEIIGVTTAKSSSRNAAGVSRSLAWKPQRATGTFEVYERSKSGFKGAIKNPVFIPSERQELNSETPTPFTIHQQDTTTAYASSPPGSNPSQEPPTASNPNARRAEKRGRNLRLFGDSNATGGQLPAPVVATGGPKPFHIALQSSSLPPPPSVHRRLPNPLEGAVAAERQNYHESTRFGSQQSPGNPLSTGTLYKFNYTLPYHGHTETGDAAGNKEGEYHVHGTDGWKRTVQYQSGANGFQPRIRYSFEAASVGRSRDETVNHVEFKWFN